MRIAKQRNNYYNNNKYTLIIKVIKRKIKAIVIIKYK